MAGTILTKYALESLSIEDKARLGCLPERLSFGEILLLWEPNKNRQSLYETALENAYETWQKDPRKGLKAEGKTGISSFVHPDSSGWGRKGIVVVSDDTALCTTHRDDFRNWLEQEGEWPLPDDCLLSRWWNLAMTQTEPDPKVSGETKGREHVQERRDRPPKPSAVDGRPAERQRYLREIWDFLDKPGRNSGIWKELSKRKGKEGCPVTDVQGNVSVTWVYGDGRTETVLRHKLETDMSIVRKTK